MAIKLGVKKRKIAVREFTDRVEPRLAFWNRYEKMQNEGSTIISYYGAGGVGKSSLLEKLKVEIDEKILAQNISKNVVYVSHDFSNAFDARTVLQTLKVQLTNRGCEFPMFETGDFYYLLKIGDANEMDAPKIKTIVEKNKWLNKVQGNWGKTVSIIDALVPGVNAVATAISIVGDKLLEYWKSKKILDEEHRELNYRLNAAQFSNNPYDLYKILPELFARDVRDWLGEEKSLIIFLDTYENLVNETGIISEQKSKDLWLRSDNGDPTGIMFLLPNTLWVIAGRNKLRWSGELAGELEQHLITALSEEDSNHFLKTAGVESCELRDRITKLTQGFPIYLDLCVDVYQKYKETYGSEPDISVFDIKRYEVADRLMKYLDAPTQDMVKFLCALNCWTDEIVYDLSSALPGFSVTTYNQVKNFSFIQSEEQGVYGSEIVEVYNFDRTVQNLLFTTCDKYILKKLDEIAKKYFLEKLKSIDVDDVEKYIFYLKNWTDLIIRLNDKPDTLREIYENNLEDGLYLLLDCGEFDIVENISVSFLNKIHEFDGNNKLDCAYIEGVMSDIKRYRGLYEESLKFSKSSYEAYLEEFGEKNYYTLQAMHNLSGSYNTLGRLDEALELEEKALALSDEVLKGHSDEKITKAEIQNQVADILADLGRCEEALNLQEQSLNLIVLDGISDEQISDKQISGAYKLMKLMDSMAVTLSYLGRYEEALDLQKKVLEFGKKIYSEHHFQIAYYMYNLACTLNHMGRYEEALNLYEKSSELYKAKLGERHPNTLTVMESLAVALLKLGRFKESIELHRKCLAVRKEILGENHYTVFYSMGDLALALSEFGKFFEASELQKKVVSFLDDKFGEKHPNAISAKENLANIFSHMGQYEEALKLHEKCLELRKEVLGDKHPDTLSSLNNLACTLADMGDYEKAQNLQGKTVEYLKEILGEDHPITLVAQRLLAQIYGEIGNYEEKLNLLKKVYEIQKNTLGENNIDSVMSLGDIAFALKNLGRYEECLELQKKILESCKEIYGESHLYVMRAKQNLIETLILLKRYNEAFEMQEKLLSVFQEIFGKKNVDTLFAMHNMAKILMELENIDEAFKIQNEVTELANDFCKESDNIYVYIKILNNMSDILYRMGKLAEAEETIERALDLSTKYLPKKNILAIQTREMHQKIFSSI